jgi:hypothetical protein
MRFLFALPLMLLFLFVISESRAFSKTATFLVIGDSHTVGDFGQRLHEKIGRLPEARVASYGSWGSSPLWWIDGTPTTYEFRAWDLSGNRELIHGVHPTPLLKDLASEIHPSVIVVALGSNLLGSPSEWIDQSVRQLMDEAHAEAPVCVWIGPPSMRQNGAGKILNESDYAAVYGALKQYALQDGCILIDSHSLTHYPPIGGDGIHYDFIPWIGPTLARRWADDVYRRLASELGY